METPKKLSNLRDKSFSPVTLPTSPVVGSPQKNLTGSPRIARDLTADLYNNIQKWNDFHIKGSQLVKQIVSLKDCDDIKTNPYTPELETLMNSLWHLTQNLKVHRNLFETLMNQIKALDKLQSDSKVLFTSLEIEKFSSYFVTICGAYLKEFEMKTVVLENIAHCKNKSDAMFLACCWTHQLCITSAVNVKLEALLVESGHRKYN